MPSLNEIKMRMGLLSARLIRLNYLSVALIPSGQIYTTLLGGMLLPNGTLMRLI